MRVIEQDEWREIGDLVAALEALVDVRMENTPVGWRLHALGKRVDRIANDITARALDSRRAHRRIA
jgi:hypothetical protein